MDFRIISKEKLCSHNTVKVGIINLKDRISELNSLLTNTRAPSYDNTCIQGGKNKADFEEKRLSWIAEKQELENILAFRQADVRRVERALEALSDEQQIILDRFYIHRSHDYLVRLMDELGYERRAIYYRHDSALKDFTLAMFSMVEDS